MSAVPLHHVIDGPADAPVVLMLGSLGSTVSMWEPQVTALSQQYRVVRADTRGHGGSPVPRGPYLLDDLVDDAVALLDELGVQRAHVVGLSLGGMTVLRLAAREPHRVGRVAVLCSSAHLAPASAWQDRAALVRAQGTAAVADVVVHRWFTQQFGTDHPALVEQAKAMVAATPAEGYASCCEAIAAMDLRDDLPAIAAPLLAIAGAQDPATPPEHLALVADTVPQAQLLVLEQAAHLASAERVEAVNAALLTFLGQTDTATAGMRVRRAVLGEEHVDRAVAATTRLTAPFQDFITRTAWGQVWTRPGLDRRARSMLTLSLLTALGQTHELAMHVRAAVTNGLTVEEIGEVLLHTAVYAGVPAANSAFAVARDVLHELGLDGPPDAHGATGGQE